MIALKLISKSPRSERRMIKIRSKKRKKRIEEASAFFKKHSLPHSPGSTLIHTAKSYVQFYQR